MGNRLLPEAAVFDMDGLLVDTEPLHAETFVKVFGESGIQLTLPQYRGAVTLGGMNTRDLFRSLGGSATEWDRVLLAKHAAFELILRQKGRLMPGAIQLLQTIREARIPTAVATSARRRSLEIITNHFDLTRYFDATVAYEDAQADKPDPTAFLLAAQRLGAAPSDCVVFEDSPRGVLAAHRAGMKCIAVPNASTAGGDFSPATLIADTLQTIDIETIRALWDMPT